MNLMEKQMVELLVEMKDNYNVAGVKAEFETEGIRIEEAMRLKEISLKAGLDLSLKIGGCGAIKDMFDAINLGVERVIAPMIETAYALKKYVHALNIAFGNREKNEVQFIINIETITAFKNIDEILSLPEIKAINGIIIGRGDLCDSMGLTRAAVNSDRILDISLQIAEKAKSAGLKVAVGGSVHFDSLPFFKAFPERYIDYFETRKIIFSCPAALNNPAAAFLKATEFELMWLKNKKNYYGVIHREDDARLQMMEERYRESIDDLIQCLGKN